MNFFQLFFPSKFELLNSGCGLSVSVAYRPVFTVIKKHLFVSFRPDLNLCITDHSCIA